MKPKEIKAFVFYVVATLCFLEFGNSLRNLLTKEYLIKATADDPFASFVLVQNTGGAFSILQNYTLALAILGAVSVLVIAYCVWRYVTFKDKVLIFSSVLFSAGILGNALERFTNGYVIDYIKLNFVDFAIFNAFDVMICAAVVFYLYKTMQEEIKKVMRK